MARQDGSTFHPLLIPEDRGEGGATTRPASSGRTPRVTVELGQAPWPAWLTRASGSRQLRCPQCHCPGPPRPQRGGGAAVRGPGLTGPPGCPGGGGQGSDTQEGAREPAVLRHLPCQLPALQAAPCLRPSILAALTPPSHAGFRAAGRWHSSLLSYFLPHPKENR